MSTATGMYVDFGTCHSRVKPNHAVTLVGYGNLGNSQPYWLIKVY